MMSRILGRHPRVHTFNELHFFDELTSPRQREAVLPRDEQVELLSRLLTIERDGYLHQRDPDVYAGAARDILSAEDAEPESPDLTPAEVFVCFLTHEIRRRQAAVACDQTPRNVFHLGEIHRHFPACRVVNMVRDPRAVLLSQKNKWRRRFLGGDGVPAAEALRAWINYHPITISQLWRSAVRAADDFEGEPWLRTVRFEDLVAEPEEQVRAICEFVGLDFSGDLLSIPQVGSSIAPDRPDRRGIDPSRVGRWREGGLSDTEIWICQKITGSVGRRHGYEPVPVAPGILGAAGHGLAFPLKSLGALLANVGRFSDVWDAVRQRIR